MKKIAPKHALTHTRMSLATPEGKCPSVSSDKIRKTISKIITASAFVAGLLGATAPLQAAIIEWTYTGGTGEWSTATNWDGGVVPVVGDTASLVSSTDHAQVTTAFNSGGNSNILMRNGASLAVSADFLTIFNWDLGITGFQNTNVTQTAGTIVGRTFNLGKDGQANTFDAKYSISGGEGRFTTVINIQKNGILEVDGNLASLENLGNVSMTNGTLSYILAADGVTRLRGATKDFTIGASSLLEIDASSYTGGVGQIELANFNTITGSFDVGNISITGLAEGLSGNITYSEAATSMYLNVIPEPGTYALIGGLLALGHVMVRRRR